jgi:uncharacterized protein (DUF952 family)
MLIYHIVLPGVWRAFDGELYAAASLIDEGFIHCSYAEQVDAVLERYYNNVESVIILEIDTEKLLARLIEEPSTNNEIYPHLYGPINRDSIVRVGERNIERG